MTTSRILASYQNPKKRVILPNSVIRHGHLLEDLVTRGLAPERRCLFVIDGAKALRAAIERVFGERAEVQRCQLHKRRNVKEYLPKNAQGDYDRRIRKAYAMTGHAEAKAELTGLLACWKRRGNLTR
jgi:putative transposase